MQVHQRLNSRLRPRDAFTLIELLIATAILLILTTLTVAVYSTTASADRIRSSARQVQSAFGGARDRGFKAWKENPLARRGLRLLVDSADPTTVTSLIYIGSEDYWTDGFVLVGRPDNPGGVPDGYADSNVIRTLRGYNTGWVNLYNQGLLVTGARIQLPAGIDSAWYTVDTRYLGSYAGGPEILILTSDFRQQPTVPLNLASPPGPPIPPPVGGDGKPGAVMTNDDGAGMADDFYEIGWPGTDDVTDIHAFSTAFTYQLELTPTVLPGQEPLRLSSNISIDLFNSRIPRAWYQEQSLPRGTALPAPNTDQNGFPNVWGAWSIEGPDRANAPNDIYRQYSPRMDVMFTPQGAVMGALSAFGPIHFRLGEVQDIRLNRDPADPQALPMLYSSLFPQTGYVGTYQVDLTDSNSDGYADDPSRLARIGGTAGR